MNLFRMVLHRGFDPRYHAYQACALATRRMEDDCGSKETRTPHLLNAIEALSQMSYEPVRG